MSLLQFLKMVFNQLVLGVNVSSMRKYKKGVKTKLTKNFSSTEFDCKCKDPECQWTAIDLDHVNKLQKKRDKWNKSITINSAFRCEKHNKAVGGATNSRHRVSDATDIQVKDMSPSEVADDCEDFDGLGRYNSFTHIDSRGSKARWDFSKKE